MTIENSKTPDVEKIDPTIQYFARLEFRSIGDGPEVQPFFSYSHNFPDNYEGPWPASFIAMRDISFMLAKMVQTVYNTEVDDLPEDPEKYAELSIGMAQKQNKTVQ